MSDFVLCLKCAPGHRQVPRQSCPHRRPPSRPLRDLEIVDLSDSPPFELRPDSDRLVIGNGGLNFEKFLGGQKVVSKIREIHFSCDGSETGNFQVRGFPVNFELVLSRLLALDILHLELVSLAVPHSGSAPRPQPPLQGVTLAQAVHVALSTALMRKVKVIGMRGKIVRGKWMEMNYENWEWRGLEKARVKEIHEIDDSMFQILEYCFLVLGKYLSFY